MRLWIKTPLAIFAEGAEDGAGLSRPHGPPTRVCAVGPILNRGVSQAQAPIHPALPYLYQ